MHYLILAVFILIMVVVGIVSSRKIKTTDDFVLGGRKMGPWLSAFSYGTTYFSAVVFVGYAGRYGWSFGLASTWIGIGNAIFGSLLAWLLLAEKTRKVSSALNVNNMADFFGRRYDSKGLEKFAAMIIFVFLIPYSASVYQGLGHIFTRFFAGTALESLPLSMFLMAVITAVYLYFGGYVSTAINSLIQGIIMLFGTVYMIWKVLDIVGGLRAGTLALAAEGDATGSLASITGPAPFDLLILLLMTSFGTFGLPQMVSKFKGLRDRKTVRMATVMSTVFALIIGGGAYFMGGLSRVLNQKLNLGFEQGDSLDTLMPLIFENLLTKEFMAVLVVLMLSASMSTLASIVLVSAPTFSKTILKKDNMLVLRLLSIAFVFVSWLVAVIPSAIVTLMAFSWGAVSGSFIGPYIWGLYSRKITRFGAAAGMVSGLATVITGAAAAFLANSSTAASWSPRLAVLAMVVSLVVTPVASLISQRWSKIPEGANVL
ncbi:MAG: sodium:solute symporter [Eubacteriales bacterium]|nr:sodium:solute symporter [Eubacteriales bacterium]MDD3196956.1 sodium:solute symporter [Eubacteriales bacterium]MDD3502653.1 sodium:solute symporter [Eubacteriales bacterium]MDD4681715.1 sodium:solute symporter [Eubacteriales bacterium]